MKYLILTILLTLTQYANAVSLSLSSITQYGLDRENTYTDWSFVNSPEQASWTGSQFMIGSGSVYAILGFRLSEPVAYSFNNTAIAFGGQLTNSIWFSDPGFFKPYPPPVYSERVTDSSFIHMAGEGILNPGTYWFEFRSMLDEGVSVGYLSLTMNRVPDAGSTLTLLGLAIGALGLYRKAT